MLKIINEFFRLFVFAMLMMTAIVVVIYLAIAPIALAMWMEDAGYPAWLALPAMISGYLLYYVVGRSLGLISDWSEGLEFLDLKKD